MFPSLEGFLLEQIHFRTFAGKICNKYKAELCGRILMLSMRFLFLHWFNFNFLECDLAKFGSVHFLLLHDFI